MPMSRDDLRVLLRDAKLVNWRSAKLIDQWRGWQADCFLVSPNCGGEQVVVKLFQAEQNSWNWDAEFRALLRFNELTKDTANLVTPRPLRTFTSRGRSGYTMSAVAGDRIGVASIANMPDVARTIVGALRRYYDGVGDVYGDFHPGNIFVSEEGIVAFIDPTSPGPDLQAYQRADIDESGQSVLVDARLASDLGAWVFTLATMGLGIAIPYPRFWWSLQRFSRHLLRPGADSAGDRDAFLADVQRAAARRARAQWRTSASWWDWVMKGASFARVRLSKYWFR